MVPDAEPANAPRLLMASCSSATTPAPVKLEPVGIERCHPHGAIALEVEQSPVGQHPAPKRVVQQLAMGARTQVERVQLSERAARVAHDEDHATRAGQGSEVAGAVPAEDRIREDGRSRAAGLGHPRQLAERRPGVDDRAVVEPRHAAEAGQCGVRERGESRPVGAHLLDAPGGGEGDPLAVRREGGGSTRARCRGWASRQFARPLHPEPAGRLDGRKDEQGAIGRERERRPVRRHARTLPNARYCQRVAGGAGRDSHAATARPSPATAASHGRAPAIRARGRAAAGSATVAEYVPDAPGRASASANSAALAKRSAGSFSQRGEHGRLDVRRHRGALRPQQRRAGSVSTFATIACAVGPGERRLAGEHLVEHGAERVEVGARVDARSPIACSGAM